MTRPTRLRRILARDDGASLVELLVGGALGIIMIGVAASILVSSQASTDIIQRKGYSLDDARVAVQRMGDDVRAATSITPYTDADCGSATPNSCVVMLTKDPDGNAVTVRYRYTTDQGTGAFARAEKSVSGTYSDVPILRGVQNTDVTTLDGDTVDVRLEVSQNPSSPETVLLEDTLTARNAF